MACTVTSSAGAVPGLRTRTKYVAIVPAYFVAGPRQSTSSSGLRQKISLEASDFKPPSAVAIALTSILPASRGVSSTSTVWLAPAAKSPS